MAAKNGGAISAYQPVDLTRNLFNRNSLQGTVGSGETFKGTALYLNVYGNQSVIRNCVFDKNYCEFSGNVVDSVANIYFDNNELVLSDKNISNCTFFNFNEYNRSVFNDNQDTVKIYNSIFYINDRSREDSVVYFNRKVISHYCDLRYSLINDTVNHNFDEEVDFGGNGTTGVYYFASDQHSVIDKGDPDHSFNDHYLPPGYNDSINDLGVSGGPYNPPTTGSFLFEEPRDLTAIFSIIGIDSACFTYTFECRGDFVDSCEVFYWFLPDTIIITDTAALTYTFSPDLAENPVITVLGQNSDVEDSYGFAQREVNLELVRINSLSTDPDINPMPVSEIPYTFHLSADIEIMANAQDVVHNWRVFDISGIGDYSITNNNVPESEFTVGSLTDSTATIKIEYEISACDAMRVRKDSVEIMISTSHWGPANIKFLPVAFNNDVPDTTSFKVVFDKVMVKLSGDSLQDSDFNTYVKIYHDCDGLSFKKSIEYSANTTIFSLHPIDNAQQPKQLCNGNYTIDVNGDSLKTKSYQIISYDTSKTYYVTTGIDEWNLPELKHIYPNPFFSDIIIDFSNPGDYYIEVIDMTGHVRQTGYYYGEKEIDLNLTVLANGMYVLLIVDQNDPQKIAVVKINKITP